MLIPKAYENFYNKTESLKLFCYGLGRASMYLENDPNMAKALANINHFVTCDEGLCNQEVLVGSFRYTIKPLDALKDIENPAILILAKSFDATNNDEFLKISNQIKNINPLAICFDYKEIYAQGYFEFHENKSLGHDIANSSRFVIINILDTDNIGDHAIAISQKEYFSKHFENEIIEFPYSIVSSHINIIKKYIREKDIIILTGGGYLNTFWASCFDIVSNIVRTFTDNNIILMPQTIYFENNEKKEIALVSTQNTFSAHRKLLLCAREETSLKIIKECYPTCKALLLPDIAFSSSMIKPTKERKGIGIGLRHNSKGNENLNLLTEKDYAHLLQLCSNIDDVFITSQRNSSLNGYFNLKERDHLVREKLQEVAGYKLYVTDYLHGSIFSLVAGTPCLSIANATGKSVNVYDTWLSQIAGVHMSSKPHDITIGVLEKLIDTNVDYRSDCFSRHFDSLKNYIDDIEGIIKRHSK